MRHYEDHTNHTKLAQARLDLNLKEECTWVRMWFAGPDGVNRQSEETTVASRKVHCIVFPDLNLKKRKKHIDLIVWCRYLEHSYSALKKSKGTMKPNPVCLHSEDIWAPDHQSIKTNISGFIWHYLISAFFTTQNMVRFENSLFAINAWDYNYQQHVADQGILWSHISVTAKGCRFWPGLD